MVSIVWGALDRYIMACTLSGISKPMSFKRVKCADILSIAGWGSLLLGMVVSIAPLNSMNARDTPGLPYLAARAVHRSAAFSSVLNWYVMVWCRRRRILPTAFEMFSSQSSRALWFVTEPASSLTSEGVFLLMTHHCPWLMR